MLVPPPWGSKPLHVSTPWRFRPMASSYQSRHNEPKDQRPKGVTIPNAIPIATTLSLGFRVLSDGRLSRLPIPDYILAVVTNLGV